MIKSQSESNQPISTKSTYFKLEINQSNNVFIFTPTWIAKLRFEFQQLISTFFGTSFPSITKRNQALFLAKNNYILSFLNFQADKKYQNQIQNEVLNQTLKWNSSVKLQYFQNFVKELIKDQNSQNVQPINEQIQSKNILKYLQQKFLIQQLSKIQAISYPQKLFRLQLINNFFQFQIYLSKNQYNCPINLTISTPKKQRKLSKQKSIIQLMQSKCNIFNNQFNKQLINFLLLFYKQFKDKTTFFPPKLDFCDVSFNQQNHKFVINIEWGLTWSFGLLEQPINLENKILKGQTPQINENKIQNPLAYVNPLHQKQERQFIQSIDKIKDQQKIIILQNQQKKIILSQSLLKCTQNQEFTTEHKKLREKLIKLKNQKKSQWQNIDQFISVFNILMLIYFLTFMSPFDIFQELDQNNMFLKKFDLQNKNFQELKIDFICQCFTNNYFFWIILIFCFQNQKQLKQNIQLQMKKQKLLTFNTLLSLLVYNQQSNNKYQILQKKAKKNGQTYVSLLKNLSFPQSVMLITIHNSVRYLTIIFVTKLYQIDALYYPQVQYGQTCENLQKLKEIQEIKTSSKKVNKFKVKSFQKINEYLLNKEQMRQNNRILTSKAQQQLKFVQKIIWLDFFKLSYKDLANQRKQIIERMVPFISEFIYQKKNLKHKELQINYQFKQRITPEVKKRQIIKFLIQNFIMNFSLLEVLLNQLQKSFIGQIYFDEEKNSKIKTIIEQKLIQGEIKGLSQLIFISLKNSKTIKDYRQRIFEQIKKSVVFNLEFETLEWELIYFQKSDCFFGFGIVQRLNEIIDKGIKQNYLTYSVQWKMILNIIKQQKKRLNQQVQ